MLKLFLSTASANEGRTIFKNSFTVGFLGDPEYDTDFRIALTTLLLCLVKFQNSN